MRLLFTLLASMALLTTRAQSALPLVNGWGFAPSLSFAPFPEYTPINKWQLRPYTAVSAGYIFAGGQGMSYVTAPVGLALYRPLNKNFTAFAAATVAPTLFNYGAPGPLAKPGFNTLGWNAGVTGGLMWTNDAKTFSISGSVSVERGSYPVYAPPASSPPTRKY
ncbi:MAG TPA: hypothetical protein VL547_04415 [Dinghuibacter sp.]|uniref:hypothetical protein n=1 Tax=Dinghuibacter sp. TaxID=2024697 RepID=UPI002B52595A|nr:hypothetical protein [Dinghuibacter sp.]HTJ11238.1 hypothetical protein [Dinghuibacter sp.]